MSRRGYPTTFAALTAWAEETGISVVEARRRFAQYGVLNAIASSRTLSQALIFRGGNALDFFWSPNRSTLDLDFTLDASLEGSPIGGAGAAGLLRAVLSGSLDDSSRALNITYGVNSVAQQPPGVDKTFIIYQCKVGYALQDDPQSQHAQARAGTHSRVIQLDISINDIVCESETRALTYHRLLRVCTPEDIAAEKLRALLQQPIRNRIRSQDLLDIAVLLARRSLDEDKVGRFLLEKAAARNVPVTRAAFRHPVVIANARQDYNALAASARDSFVPFADALAIVLALVDRLAIPVG